MYLLKLMIFMLLFSTSLGYGRECSPIPKDKTKLPVSLEEDIKAIANLCDLQTLEQKVRKIEQVLKNIKKCMPHYESLANNSRENFNYFNSIGLWTMQFLYDSEEMQIYWKFLFNDETVKEASSSNTLYQYLRYRAIGYNIRSKDATDTDKAYTTFKYNWEHDVYRGLYCMSYINPPPPYKRITN